MLKYLNDEVEIRFEHSGRVQIKRRIRLFPFLNSARQIIFHHIVIEYVDSWLSTISRVRVFLAVA